MERLTYKSDWGDYGSRYEYNSYPEEIHALRDRLGRYEDLGYAPEQITELAEDQTSLCKKIANYIKDVCLIDDSDYHGQNRITQEMYDEINSHILDCVDIIFDWTKRNKGLKGA